MKKASFTALLYREYLLCRKSLRVYAVSCLIFTLIPIMVIFSLRWGNLTMLPENIVADIRADNDLMLTLFVVICPCMLMIAVSESAVFDAKIQWDRFRRSTPVKPAKMALAKYALFLILLLLSAAVCAALMALSHWLLGTPVMKTDIAVIVALITGISMLSVMAQVFIMLFRSVDRGMLVMLGCAAAVIFLIPGKWRASFSVERLLGGAEALLPITPVILLGILTIGFGLTTFIYARREK